MNVPEFEGLRLTEEGDRGHMLLDRPAKLNALSARLLQDLATAARWFDTRRHVKAVTVAGAGRAFSAGFDLNDFAPTESELPMREVADLGRIMAEAVTEMRAITIAAIHGRCVGGGLVLAAACDLRIAAETTIFSIPEVDLGIPLAWAGIPRLVREIGPALTKELVLTCREFAPAEAQAAGFLNRVVPDDEVASAADELARLLAGKSTLTLTATKRHVNAVAEEIASTRGGGRDADVMMSALNDPESREVARSYLEARQARRSTV